MPSLRTLPNDLRLFAKYHLKRRVFDHPATETELGVVPLEYDPDRYISELYNFSDRFRVSTLAEITYRDRRHAICSIHHGSAPRRVLVLSGVHGNERAGILAVPRLLERIDRDRERYSRTELCVITPVNPVGATHLSRYNGSGFDINRDFVRFETPEAQAVRAVFVDFDPDFVVSLHEGPQDATFFFANRYVDHALARRLLGAMERGGTTLARTDYFGRTLEPPGYAPMSTSGWALSYLWARTLAMKAAGMWADDRGVPEITLESSWRMPDAESRIRAHVDLVLALLDELAAQ